MITCALCRREVEFPEIHKNYCPGNFPKKYSTQVAVGFKNYIGEQNCFLNSALQALCHMPGFLNSLLSKDCKVPNCLVCCLQEVLKEYLFKKKNQTGGAVSISALREKLAEDYLHLGEFQLFCSADAMEALLALFNAVHNNSASENQKCKEKCPSHQVAELSVAEFISCECGESKKIEWDYSCFAHPFYVNSIIEASSSYDYKKLLDARNKQELFDYIENSSVLPNEGKLAEHMMKQWEDTQLVACSDSECEISKSYKKLYLGSVPKVFIVNMIWKNPTPKELEILQVIASLPFTLSLDKVYLGAPSTVHNLRGMILYGFGHYVYCLRSTETNGWYKLDDDFCRMVSTGEWSQMVKDIITKRFYPVGLFFYQETQTVSVDMTLGEWLDLERYVAGYELEKQKKEVEERVAMTVSNENWNRGRKADDKTSKTRSKSSLGFQKKLPESPKVPTFDFEETAEEPKNQETSQSVINIEEEMSLHSHGVWMCDCGVPNSQKYSVCSSCNKLKPGEDGWVCRHCTYKNEQHYAICRGCYNTKRNQEIETPAKEEMIVINGRSPSKPKERPNPTSLPKPSYPRNLDGKLYYETSEKLRKEITRKLESPLNKHWKCSCGKVNNQENLVCADCSELKFDEKGWSCKVCTFKNEETTFRCKQCKRVKGTVPTPVKVKKCEDCGKEVTGSLKVCEDCLDKQRIIRENSWRCKFCKHYNLSEDFCRNCKEYRYAKRCQKCQKNTVNFNETYCSKCSDQCCVCKEGLEKSFCYSCKTQVNSYRCKNCKKILYEKLCCEKCVSKFWKCSNCKTTNFPLSKRCYECENPKAMQRPASASKRPTRNAVTISSRKPMCSSCYKVLNASNLKFCPFCRKKPNEKYIKAFY